MTDYESDSCGVTTFSNAPNEVKLMIADKLPISDINAIARTSTEANDLLTVYMYRRAVVERSRSGAPFFYPAVALGCLPAARMFIKLGVDVNMRVLVTGTGEMCCEDDRDVESDVPETDDPSGAYQSGHTPLHVAIQGRDGYEPMARLLIDEGAEISAPCREFLSALHKAVWKGATAIVELLLIRGADPFVVNRRGQSFLHIASAGGPPNLVRLLLGVGFDIEARDHLGWTALHWAAFMGDADSVEALLSSGADVQAIDLDGNTPLLVAVHNRGSESMGQRLLDHGGTSPVALRKAEVEATEAFLFGGREIRLFPGEIGSMIDPLPLVDRNDRIIELLLEAGSDIAAQNTEHYSPLLWAIYSSKCFCK